MSYHESVVINAPVDIVWNRLADVERWPESTASITSVQRLDDGPFQVGSRARVQQPKLPTMVWQVTDFQPRREFSWQTQAPGSTTIGRHAITAVGEGTCTVTLSIERTGVLARLVDALFAKITRQYVNMEAAGLKRVSEADAQRAASPV